MDEESKAAAIPVEPGTIVVFSDITCPWAHLAIHRLHETRARLALQDEVVIDPRAFPLELVNEQATPKRILDAEMPVTGALEPDAGWQVWQRPESEYPVTSLPALEAVHAAKEQGPRVAEHLDRALRRAFFGASVNISMRHEILAVAATVDGLDVDRLADALGDGRARAHLTEDHAVSERSFVRGSPHLFLPDGTDTHNPGIEMHWEGEHGEGFPVVDADDPSVYEDILDRAATGGR